MPDPATAVIVIPKRTLSRAHTVAWLLWALTFVAIEGQAVLDKDPGDTLSEHVWHWAAMTGKPRGWQFRRYTLIAGMAVLGYHFIVEGKERRKL